MKYQFFEFHLLQSVSLKKTDTLGRVYEVFTSYMGTPVTMPCFLYALRGLMDGEYVTLDSADGILTPDTPIAITEAGRKAVGLSFLQKLLGEYKATVKKELAFCRPDRPHRADSLDLHANAEDFAPLVRPLAEARDIQFPAFEVTDLGEGCFKLTVHHPNDDLLGEYDEEDLDPDGADLSYSASVTGTAQQIAAGLHHLILTAHALLTEPPRTRKVALHGGDGSLLITMANAANEQGLVSFRTTVARIRFNRQRFVGKRDSDLDYAQCGDPLFIHEMTSAESFCYFAVLYSAAACPDLLTEEDVDRLTEIHRLTRPLFTA